MHSTFYPSNQATPINVVEKHKKALESFIKQLINGTYANAAFLQKIGAYAPQISADEIPDFDWSDLQSSLRMKLLGMFRNAAEALLIIQTVTQVKYNRQPHQLNKQHIEALLAIPAITNEWELITQHPAFKEMEPEQSNRLNEIMQQLMIERRREANRLENEINKLDNLLHAIKGKEPSAPELAEIKRHFSCINGAASFESNMSHFQEVCKLIANSYNMVEKFKQALVVAEDNLPRTESFVEFMRTWHDPKIFKEVMDDFREQEKPRVNR